MVKTNEMVQKLKKEYISEDCIHVMIPYKNSITLFSKDGIQYHHVKDSKLHINKYIEDERRKEFPYHNIPTHFYKPIFGSKIIYTNQILNYEEPYLRICDNSIIESYAVKDKDSALVINKFFLGGNRQKHILTRKELEDLIYPKNNNKLYYLSLSGAMFEENKFELTSEKDIQTHIKKALKECAKELRYRATEGSSNTDYYIYNNKYMLDFLERSSDNIDLCNIDYNWDIMLNNGKILVLVEYIDKDIKITLLNIKFNNINRYEVEITDIPITKYTLEQLKHLTPKIISMKEPKISLRINPGLKKEDIKETKKLIKK